MSGEIYTEKKLKWLLESKYGCTCLGKPMPRPYVSEDDMPTYYRTPTGHNFDVPPPPDGVGYKPWLVEKIIEAGKLNVVVELPIEVVPEQKTAKED